MAPDDQSRAWHPGPESSSASGGHIAPDPLIGKADAARARSERKEERARSGNGEARARATEGGRAGATDIGRSSIDGFDPLTAPLPSELAWDERSLLPSSGGSEWKDWGATMERARRGEDEQSRARDTSPHSRAVSASQRSASEVAFLDARQSALREEGRNEADSERGAAGGRASQSTARLRPADAESVAALRETDARAAEREARPRRRETGPQPVPQRGRRARLAPRPVRRTLKHIHPLGVLKMSLFFYAIFLLVWLMVAAVIYWLLDGLGLFSSIEEFATAMEIPGWKDVDISLGTVQRWALVIGAIFAVVATIVNVFLAFLYNLGSDIFGGIDLTFLERGEK